MRRPAKKKSRRRSGAGGPVSLFPFLAVLICTMGSLILLLVVIARQARLQAAESDESGQPALAAKLERELGIAQMLASQLDESRAATDADLQDARLKLGQIEDHTAELRRRLASLKAAWKRLNEIESGKESAREAAETERHELARRIQRLQQEIEEAKRTAEGREAAYSIVPYEGPHGTRRRPIYIECRSDGLVLQPEGIRFDAEDFEGPLDAGNPLDVALRAVREYLAAQPQPNDDREAEPYPLLLVRPSGIAYYYAGRAAMKSWGTEFGYELIGEDWQLDFPEPNEDLARSVRQAVEPARRRQRMLVAAAPSRYGSGGQRPVYTVKPYRGGVMSRGGSGPRDDEPSGLSLRGDRSAAEIASRSSQAGGFGQPQGTSVQTDRPTARPDENSGGPGGSAGSSNPAGSGSPAAGAGNRSQAAQSLAKARGRNWGLPDANRNAVAITRPIRVECHPDRLVIVPEAGLGQPEEIAVREETEASIDTFVSAVWDYMEKWGRAGRAMYWRPVLNVYAGPGAEPRVSELETLLQDSGLLVNRSGRLPAAPRAFD